MYCLSVIGQLLSVIVSAYEWPFESAKFSVFDPLLSSGDVIAQGFDFLRFYGFGEKPCHFKCAFQSEMGIVFFAIGIQFVFAWRNLVNKVGA